MKDIRDKNGKTTVRGLLAGILLLTAAAVVIITLGGKTMIVGKNIRKEDISDFYFTYDASTDPPYFQRYRFFTENGRYYFYHEKREGDHWPLVESDVTFSGKKELNEEEWDRFFELLKDGKVEKRQEHLESGGRGPWLFLYWKKDRSKYQEFSFASYEKQLEFEGFCKELAE